ncbi:hypothetical protein Pelo_8181 [Pelomyxa schiedti]|nr:hypothetical protein Pelo_8181 [Pelomyxa schiedti]
MPNHRIRWLGTYLMLSSMSKLRIPITSALADPDSGFTPKSTQDLSTSEWNDLEALTLLLRGPYECTGSASLPGEQSSIEALHRRVQRDVAQGRPSSSFAFSVNLMPLTVTRLEDQSHEAQRQLPLDRVKQVARNVETRTTQLQYCALLFSQCLYGFNNIPGGYGQTEQMPTSGKTKVLTELDIVEPWYVRISSAPLSIKSSATGTLPCLNCC